MAAEKDMLLRAVSAAKSVVILGHVHPDGDCIGSTLGLWNYLEDNFPGLPADVYLDNPSEKFSYLSGFDRVKTEALPGKTYDLCVTLDVSDAPRVGFGEYFLGTSNHTVCLDHHRTNGGFAEENAIEPDTSSCSEVLYEHLDPEKIFRRTAECIYTGIIHDTGVFKYSSTSPETMRIAGEMMAKGIDFGGIIDGSFYMKSFVENRLMGHVLDEAELVHGGRTIVSQVTAETMAAYGADSNDVDGIVAQMRDTDGVECAVFLYEKQPGEFKVSLRSNRFVDVSRVAARFGGGGHIRASGCTLTGDLGGCREKILQAVGEALRESGEAGTGKTA